MGRGLSGEQRDILAFAYEHTAVKGYEVFTAQQCLVKLYGLYGHDGRHGHVESTSPKAKVARASFYRSANRLRERGLIDGKWKEGKARTDTREPTDRQWTEFMEADWGYSLTRAGKVCGENVYRLAKSQAGTSSTDSRAR